MRKTIEWKMYEYDGYLTTGAHNTPYSLYFIVRIGKDLRCETDGVPKMNNASERER